MADASRDNNRVPTLIAVSSSDGTTPVTLYADPTTHRLLVDLSGSGTGDVSGPGAAVTDNAIARWHTTSGTDIQNSVVLIADTTGNISGMQKITVGVASGATGSIEVKGTTSGTVTIKSADAAGTYTLTLPTSDGDASQFLQTDGAGVLTWAAQSVPTTVTVANEATDVDSFLGFFTAASGDLGPKTNANLTFNSSTGVATFGQTISGSITGNAGTLTVADEAADTSCYLGFYTGASGSLAGKTNANLTFNSSTGVATFGQTIVGSVSGNAGTVTVADEAADTTCFIGFYTAASGSLPGKTNTNLTFNASTGVLTSASLVATTADVNGGTVDSAVIGGATPAAITGTTIDATTDFTIGGTVITNNTITDDGTLIINATTATSFSEGNITNVGDIGLDSLTADATSIALNSPLQLIENAPIMLDAVMSADEKYSGITTTGTLGATIGVGDIVYLAVADSRWELADASVVGTAGNVPLAIVLVAGNDGDATTLLLVGKVRSAAFPVFTVAAPLYVSETAGDITGTAPVTTDSVMRRVGFALTAEDLYFNPSNDYVTHV